MFGLTYIRSVYNMSMQDLADRLGISRQTIYKWEKKIKPIPKKRIKQLCEIFKLDAKYFNMELTEIDKQEIQLNKLNNEIYEKAITEMYEDGVNESEQTRNYVDHVLIDDLIDKKTLIESLKVIELVKYVLDREAIKKDFNYSDDVGDITYILEKRTRLFFKIVALLINKNDKLSNKRLDVLEKVIRAVEIVYGDSDIKPDEEDIMIEKHPLVQYVKEALLKFNQENKEKKLDTFLL